MKKFFVSLLLLVFATSAVAQTFPVQNLVVNGTSQFTGQGNFTLSPTAPTPTAGDSSTKVATTAFVSSAVATAAPTVANNTILKATSTAVAATVWRLGFTTSGDAPPILYRATASPCTLNAGAGDNGTQVKGSNGNCWIGTFPAGGYDIREFGADPTGTVDSTAAIQAAMNTGNLIKVPAGVFNFTTLTDPSGGISGDGPSLSILLSTDLTSADLITFTGTGASSPALFKGIMIQASLSKTAGAALAFNAHSGMLSFPQILNTQILNAPTGVHFYNTQQFVIDGVNVVNYSVAGVQIQNTFSSDAGDSAISNSFFNTSVPTGTTFAIWYQSGGGLKISNVKILGGNSGLVVAWSGTSSGAADLSVVGCSFESPATAGYAVFLGRASGTASIGSVMLSGNEFGWANGVATDTSGFLTLVNITGNVFNILGTSTSFFGISLNNLSNFIIGPNVLNAQNAGSPIGIGIASSSSNGKIMSQTFSAIPAANRISNGSSTVTFLGDTQTFATGNITTGTAYGSLFSGSTAVTFPQAYSVAPVVTCNNTSTASGGVAVIVGTTTTTGFTAIGVGVTSGGTVTGTCSANGVL